MSTGPTPAAPLPWKPWAGVLFRYSPLWLGCTLVAGALGFGYGSVRQPTWQATQPLLIRDEAGTSFERLGRFASQTEMKAAQETVAEMARNQEVITTALVALGPPPNSLHQGEWPPKKYVEEMADKRISVRPPKGTEFGSSEVLYLTTEAETQERAKQLCALILEQTSERLRLLRRVRADSIIAELKESRDIARQRLDDSTVSIQAIEEKVGPDLAELRNLSETIGGDGAVRKSLLEAQTEFQQAELELQRLKSLRAILETGRNDPQQLALAGEDLLSLQPTLKRLKDGLIDAQLSRAQLSGKYQPEHPRMKSAELQELEIRQRLAQEIDGAIEGMDPRLAVASERVARLRQNQVELSERLDRLAEMRTEYTNLSVQVRQRSEALGQAERALAEAEASRTAAVSTNFVEALNLPQVNEDPEGLPAKLLAMGAAGGGAVLGLGLVFLVAPSPSGPRFGRRWSDYGAGRRAVETDRRAPLAPGAVSVSTVITEVKPAIPPPQTPAAQVPEPVNSTASTAVQNGSERRRQPRKPPSNLFGV